MLPADAPFMRYSTCSTQDFYHPEFIRMCYRAWVPPTYHRKAWEWVFIMHHANRMGVVGPGKRGLVFGVGSEPLPGVFAEDGMSVMATDAPPEIGITSGWTNRDQFAQNVDKLPHLSLNKEQFDSLVSFQPCDMNAIDPSLRGFDLCWSSCALEHLGSLRKGVDFIINSVEQTLKVGGVAIHTTEYNLSSNKKTMEEGWCVLYRRRDMDELVAELRSRGHEVDTFSVAPDSNVIDGYVDYPPYLDQPHLKLELSGYVTTSVGIVVRRGT